MVDKLLHGYAYDVAGRLVKEGAKTYRYGYLDKVLSVTEGNTRYTYGYHVDGQLASATKYVAAKPKKGEKPKAPETEEFFWDGLALMKRGGTSYVNEPHPGNAPQKLCFGGKPRAQRSARRVRKQPRGAAVLSSKDGVMFNDILGTTLGSDGENGYTATPMTAFGDAAGGAKSYGSDALFTGKPRVDGLGHAFLFRNYRAGLGKWLTADPLGYPDGWNQLAYCGNELLMYSIDSHALWVANVSLYVSGGASTGGVALLGVALGYSRRHGFTVGITYAAGIGSEVGFSGSVGFSAQISNNRSVSELAGQSIAFGGSAGEGFVFGGDLTIPTDIMDTGYWSANFSVGLGAGTPELHTYYVCTGVFTVYAREE